MKKNILTKLACIAAAGVLAFSLTACGTTEPELEPATQDPQTNTQTDKTEADTTVITDEIAGITITIEVKDADGNVTAYTGTTDDEFLLGAVEDIDGITIDGSESEWGYYMTTVNGVTADYDTDGAYWSIYVNGEYGQYGIDSQPVTDGDVYTFAYEGAVADDNQATAKVTIEVKDAEGNVTTYECYTEDAYLYDALDDATDFTFVATEESWGHNVTTINDIFADYNNDGAYWALYVNGEYGMNGVDTQPINDGDVYTFAYEVYQAN